MTNQPQNPSTQHSYQHYSTSNSASSNSSLVVTKSVTQSTTKDQRFKTQSSTHLCITIRGWLPAALGGRGRRINHPTSVDLAGGGVRATEPADTAGWRWLW